MFVTTTLVSAMETVGASIMGELRAVETLGLPAQEHVVRLVALHLVHFGGRFLGG